MSNWHNAQNEHKPFELPKVASKGHPNKGLSTPHPVSGKYTRKGK